MITQEKEVNTQPAASLQRPNPFASIWHEALLPYLGTRVVLVLVGLLVDFYMLPLLKSNPSTDTPAHEVASEPNVCL